MSERMKGVMRGVKNEILNLANVVLKSGATNIGKQLVEVTHRENQPSEFNLTTLTHALKNGAMATGQELMAKGVDRLKAIPPEDEK